MKLIPLSQGYEAMVDDADYESLLKFKWHVKMRSDGNEMYATRWRRSKEGGSGQKVRMHRFILNAPNGIEIDHIDGNGLNNQRHNLRLCKHLDNVRNSRKLKKGINSIYKGVSRDSRYATTCWYATIKTESQRIHLGSFHDEISAAHAYDRAASYYFGAFAKVNFPK